MVFVCAQGSSRKRLYSLSVAELRDMHSQAELGNEKYFTLTYRQGTFTYPEAYQDST